MPQAEATEKTWSYAEAARTLPYVRYLLGSLREHFIKCWHFYRLNGYDPDGQAHRREMVFHRDEGVAIVEELRRMDIFPYDNPLRGIAMFPFLVYEDDKPQEAFWVYKDSRDEIDSFILGDDLCRESDLLGWERSVPEAWKRAGAVPSLAGEPTP